MDGDTPKLTLDDLPTALPIFPLQGALLLPGGELPLHIFEPRYRAMIEDAMLAERMIGMIQPREKEKLEPDDKPDVFGIGCVGQIATHNRLDDGRHLILLTGVCRFRVKQELPLMRGYRRVEPDYGPFVTDLYDDGSAVDRAQLLATLEKYLKRRKLEADWQAIGETPTPKLVSIMAMVCPFAPNEKQALMEAKDIAQRARTMMTLMQMDVAGPPGGPANDGPSLRN